ncbi:MAG: hypothetical protein CMB79_07290 [Filomicrobium sp.]|nr:hypothetical protein [Filomicrobium sp.]
MVLWDANEACCPGQPTCPVPNGAPGDQSSNISDRALDLNVSVQLTSTRAIPCQGFDDTVSIKVLPELTKALSLLLRVDVEPLLTSWARSIFGGVLLASIMVSLLAIMTCSRPDGLKIAFGPPGVPSLGKLSYFFDWVVYLFLRAVFAAWNVFSITRWAIIGSICCACWTTLVYVHCLFTVSGIVWRGKHTSLGASMRHPCEFNVMSIYELLAECGLVFVRPQAFVDRSTHKYAPYFPGVCRWKYPADATDDDEYAFMMMHDIQDNENWDAKKYPACPPYHGKRGTKFEAFVRDFSAAMMEKNDEDASLYQTMMGTDPGGDDPAAPAAGNAAAQRRRQRRLSQLYALLYRHVAEPRLREMMSGNANDNGRAAFQLLVLHCRQPVDDLQLFEMDATWDTANIVNSVGHNIDSIQSFSRYLNGLNSLRPPANQKTDDQLTIKLLSCLTAGIEPTLAHEAAKELRAGPAGRMFQVAAVPPVVGPPAVPGVPAHRDFDAAIVFFDDMWRTKFGDTIKARPKSSTSADRSTRADVNALGDEDEALVAGSFQRGPPVSRVELAKEAVCWVCRGVGHMASECPSKPGFRAISDVIDRLSSTLGRGGKGRGNKGRGGGRGFSGRGRGGGRGRSRVNVVLGEGFYVGDDGNVYTTDGYCVGSTDEAGPSDHEQPEPPPETESEVQDEADESADWIDDDESADIQVVLCDDEPHDTDGCTEASRMRRGLDDDFAFAWSLRNNNVSIPRALLGENRTCDCPKAKARGVACAHEPKANTNLCEHCTEDHAWNYLGEQCTCECEHCADNHHGQCTTRCNAMAHRQLSCNCTCVGCDSEQSQVGPDSGELTDPVADGAKRQKTTANQDATTDEGQSTHSCSRSCTHGPHFQFRQLSSDTCVPCLPRPAEEDDIPPGLDSKLLNEIYESELQLERNQGEPYLATDELAAQFKVAALVPSAVQKALEDKDFHAWLRATAAWALTATEACPDCLHAPTTKHEFRSPLSRESGWMYQCTHENNYLTLDRAWWRKEVGNDAYGCFKRCEEQGRMWCGHQFKQLGYCPHETDGFRCDGFIFACVEGLNAGMCGAWFCNGSCGKHGADGESHFELSQYFTDLGVADKLPWCDRGVMMAMMALVREQGGVRDDGDICSDFSTDESDDDDDSTSGSSPKTSVMGLFDSGFSSSDDNDKEFTYESQDYDDSDDGDTAVPQQCKCNYELCQFCRANIIGAETMTNDGAHRFVGRTDIGGESTTYDRAHRPDPPFRLPNGVSCNAQAYRAWASMDARVRRATHDTQAEASQWKRAMEDVTSQWFNGEATWSVVADDMMNTAQRVALALLAPIIALIITLLTFGQRTAAALSRACLHAIYFLYGTY